jgi:hypothetical protein
MAQQPYMGSGLLLPPLSEVTKSCAFVAVSDQPTGRAVRLNPDVSARAIWQAVRRLGWEMKALNLAYVTFLFIACYSVNFTFTFTSHKHIKNALHHSIYRMEL